MEFSIRQDELDKWNNGVLEFHLSYGQSVVLNIEENLSTGYCWELANNELNGFFTIVDLGNSDANYGALDGASTEHSYKLIAGSATGSGKFTAEYSQSWETSPFRTLSFTVNVNQRPEEVPEYSIAQGEIDDWNNGGVALDLPYGQSVILNIEENLSTGYGWELATNEYNGFFTVVDLGNSDTNDRETSGLLLVGAPTEHLYKIIAGSAAGSG